MFMHSDSETNMWPEHELIDVLMCCGMQPHVMLTEQPEELKRSGRQRVPNAQTRATNLTGPSSEDRQVELRQSRGVHSERT